MEMSEYVIGRTPAYYNDEDYIFTPAMWRTCNIKSIDKYIDPQSEVYQLTTKGEEKLDNWFDAVSAGYDLCSGRCKTDITSEEIYEIITTDSDYSIKIR